MQNLKQAMLVASILGVGIFAGCSAPMRTAEPTTHTFTLGNETPPDAVWQASQDVLRTHRFKLDRVDRRAGAITTAPLTSQHFFEFWRKDVATRYDALEATLRTIRRRADVNMVTDDATATATLTVAVHRQCFASPERQYNNSIAAMRMFSDTLPGEQTGLPVTAADNYWIDDGRDPAMERYLLEQIVARAGG